MSRVWRIFRLLVFTRPLVLGMLCLIYALGASLAFLPSNAPEHLWLIVAVTCTIPTVGIFALATERISMISVSAGELKIPRHATYVGFAQIAVSAVFIGGPLLMSRVQSLKDGLAFVAWIVAAAGLGTTLVAGRLVVVGVVIAFAALGSQNVLGEVLANAYVQGVLFLGALYLLYGWYRLPFRIEARAGLPGGRLADATHETTDAALAETFAIDPAHLDRYEQALNASVMRATKGIAAGPSAASLALGLGFELKTITKPFVKAVGIGAVVVFIWHFVHGERPEVFSYWLVTGVATVALVSGTSLIYQRWKVTAAEQSLLTLSPGWPSERTVKRLFVACVGGAQFSWWCGWGAISALALLLRSISFEQLATGAAVALAGSAGSAASLWILLSRRSLKQWHVTTILVALSATSGAIVFALRPPESKSAIAVALALILIPAVTGLATFMIRPLQFPVAVMQKN